MWERYCSGVSAVVFAVDSSIPLPPGYSTKDQGECSEEEKTARNRDSEAWNIAAEELHSLIQRPALAGLPLLVLATKNDLPNPASVQEVISVMYVALLTQGPGVTQGPRSILLQHQHIQPNQHWHYDQVALCEAVMRRVHKMYTSKTFHLGWYVHGMYMGMCGYGRRPDSRSSTVVGNM